MIYLFLRALQQNREQARLLYLLNNKSIVNYAAQLQVIVENFYFLFFAEAEAHQTQGRKLHTIGLISYATAVSVSLVAFKLKYDLY